jgi:hypothetical protein
MKMPSRLFPYPCTRYIGLGSEIDSASCSYSDIPNVAVVIFYQDKLLGGKIQAVNNTPRGGVRSVSFDKVSNGGIATRYDRARISMTDRTRTYDHMN